MFVVKRVVGCGVAAALLCAAASAATIMNDQFNDGYRNGANNTDALGGTWWSTGDGTLYTVANDAGSINGNSLKAAGVASTRTMLCFFPSSATLTNVGDTITVTADVRITTSPTGNWRELNLCLGNSAGTKQVADQNGSPSSTTRLDDTFYESLCQVTNGTGATNVGPGNLSIFKANTATSPGEDFVEAGEITASGTRGTVNSANLYTGVFSIGITAQKVATGIQLTSTVNGSSTGSVIDTSSYLTTFDMVSFQNRAGTTSSYYLDNVQVSTVVPEPSILGVIAAAGSALALRRRRRQA